jgi:exodeoxyribonuclease VII small subunit
MANKKNDLTQFTYEQALAELEAIVSSLESNQLPLQEAMDLFSRGQALVQHCTGLLDQAELKVRQVSGESLEETTAEE